MIDNRLSSESFQALKLEGKLSFEQVPALQVTMKDESDIFITQSAAIMRFIGRLAGPNVIYPVDLVQCAVIDSIVDQENDLFMGLSVSRYRDRFGFGCLDEGIVSIVRKQLNDVVIPRHLDFFDKLLDKSSTGWIAGTHYPSIADFILVPRLQWLMSGANDGISKDILLPHPKILALIEKLMNLPAVVSYYNQA